MIVKHFFYINEFLNFIISVYFVSHLIDKTVIITTSLLRVYSTRAFHRKFSVPLVFNGKPFGTSHVTSFSVPKELYDVGRKTGLRSWSDDFSEAQRYIR